MAENLRTYSLKSLLDHPEFTEGEFWHRENFEADRYVFLEGENGNEIYVILDGQVAVCTHVKISDNRQIHPGLCELFEGEEFAHFCFFDDEPHCASVKTISPCQLACIDSAKLKGFLDDHPDIGFQLLCHWMKTVIPWLRQSNKRFSTLLSWGLKAHQIDSNL
ncbi:MAG: cyclic nucleotide-binding domain-containing protein [Gammaproteobacteria bacterium]